MPKHTKLCAAQECDRTVIEARGLCKKHYKRFMANGLIERLPRPAASERFWAKVNQHGPIPEFRPDLGRCWIWEAARAGGGTGQYGRFYDGHRDVSAHRWAWEHEVGPIPEGLTIDHLCQVKLCVNPAHLEPVTQAENVRRYSRAIEKCVHGHAYTKENTYIRPQGRRKCRECNRRRNREYSRRRRLARNLVTDPKGIAQ